MNRRTLLAAIAVVALAAAPVLAQTPGVTDLVSKGVAAYQKADYASALNDFRQAATSTAAAEAGDAAFWTAMSYLALNQLDLAAKNLEYFLQHYQDNSYFEQASYQKGRILYLQKQYDQAIAVLYAFTQAYPKSPYVANSYYWIGESLYTLGHFDEAQKVFAAVVDEYPASYKVEAARYRLSLIQLQNREDELLKLLNWSHEQSLAAQDDYVKREKIYEEALVAYQEKIADLTTTAVEASPAASTAPEQGGDLAALRAAVSQLQSEVSTLISELESSTAATNPAAGAAAAGSADQALLNLKAQALDLESYYLNWLSTHAAGGQAATK